MTMRTVFRVHALQRMFERRITEEDVLYVLGTGETNELPRRKRTEYQEEL